MPVLPVAGRLAGLSMPPQEAAERWEVMWAFLSGVSVAAIVGFIVVSAFVLPDEKNISYHQGIRRGTEEEKERFESEAVKMEVAAWYVDRYGVRRWRWTVPTPADVEKDRTGPTGDFRSPADQ